MADLTVRNRERAERGRHRAVRAFASPQEAKEFLIDWIDAEARGLGVPFSAVERKMLYASQHGWTPPEMDEVQDAFDRYHEPVEYELKVANLIRMVRIDAAAARPDELKDWDAAVQALRGENHYLLELIEAAEGPRRREGSLWKLVLMAVGIIGASVAVAFWFARR